MKTVDDKMTCNDYLQVQGRMTLGYGIIPKMIMLDIRLSPEAKCIYAYFCSFAGAGTTAFPSRDKILFDLQMGENRYYKHFNLLKEYGYISVKQVIDKSGKFKRNIYTLIEFVEPYLQNKGTDGNPQNKPHPQNEGTVKTPQNKPCLHSPCTENEGIIINNFKNNIKSQSQSQTDECTRIISDTDTDTDTDHISKEISNNEKGLCDLSSAQEPSQNPHKNIKNTATHEDYITTEEKIKERISYDSFQKDGIDIDLVDNIIACMMDVIMTDEVAIIINKEKKSRELVKSVYQKLNYEHIEHVVSLFKAQRHKITYIHAYLKNMLYNVFHEMDAYYTNQVRADGIV